MVCCGMLACMAVCLVCASACRLLVRNIPTPWAPVMARLDKLPRMLDTGDDVISLMPCSPPSSCLLRVALLAAPFTSSPPPLCAQVREGIQHLLSGVSREVAIHQAKAEALSADLTRTEPSPATLAYTSFLMEVAEGSMVRGAIEGSLALSWPRGVEQGLGRRQVRANEAG